MGAEFTNFTCRAGANNLNAGTLTGSSTEEGNTAAAIFTGGTWVSASNLYTPSGGIGETDFAEAQVGRFMSIYRDEDSEPLADRYMIARITAVAGAGNGAITVSSTVRSVLGTPISSGSGNTSARIGGAWAGPGASANVGFPVSFLTTGLVSTNSDRPRINFKNTAPFEVSSSIIRSLGNQTIIAYFGYDTTFGDGGMAVFQGPNSGAAFILLDIQSSGTHWENIIFQRNGTTGTANLVSSSAGGGNATAGFRRCVFRDGRGHGLDGTVARMLVQCEAYNNLLSGFTIPSVGSTATYCIAHNNSQRGFFLSGNFYNLLHCISHNNTLQGFYITAGNGSHNNLLNCDAYENGDDGFDDASGGGSYSIMFVNCNSFKNTGYGWNLTGSALLNAYMDRCYYGAGSFVNSSGGVNISSSSDTVVQTDVGAFTSDQSPWIDPENGNFTIAHPLANNTGTITFVQVDPSYTGGTTAYISRGAAQANTSPTTAGSGGGLLAHPGMRGGMA